MNRQTVSGTILILLLISMLTLTINIQQVKATGTIYIRPDGSVDPPTAPIEQDGPIYTFTDNIYESIAVERDNVIIDGDGYSLQGTGSGCGLDLSNRNNVTIKKIHINSFDYGIRLHSSSRNNIAENEITNINHYGVELHYSDGNNITDNNIASVYYFGIGLHYSDDNIIADNDLMDTINGTSILVGNSRCDKIYHNNFINNSIRQAYVYSSYKIVWDDGYPSGGNYWSDHVTVDDYSGVYQDEPGSDGIVDEPYIIDTNNRDGYPLMSPWTGISGNLQILEPLNGQVIVGPATITFVIENTGEDVEFLEGDPTNRIDLEIEYSSNGGGWGIMFWSTSYYGLALSSGEKYEQTVVYDPSKYEKSVPRGFIGEAPYGEGTIRLVHWESLELGYWDIGEFGKTEIQVTFLQPAIAASIDFEPETLNLKSRGRWITVYIELPEGCNANDIEISTVKLNGEVQAELHPTKIGDYDNDGISDLMVKFGRANVVRSILRTGEDTLTITGTLIGKSFEGSEAIRVVHG